MSQQTKSDMRDVRAGRRFLSSVQPEQNAALDLAPLTLAEIEQAKKPSAHAFMGGWMAKSACSLWAKSASSVRQAARARRL